MMLCFWLILKIFDPDRLKIIRNMTLIATMTAKTPYIPSCNRYGFVKCTVQTNSRLQNLKHFQNYFIQLLQQLLRD